MTYLRNAWYMIAWSDEIGEQLLERTVLEMPIVLFRHSETGAPVALLDRCPHRFAPLSRGKRLGNDIQCGYHGLQFNASGHCVRNFFSNAVPAAAKVRAFPLLEQDRIVWVWTGDPETVTGTPPRFEFHTDPNLRCVFGMTVAQSDYRLLMDNLMDLSHTAFLHPAFGGEHWVPKFRSWEEDNDVVSDYLVPNLPDIFGGSATIQEQDTIRWISPAAHYLVTKTTSSDTSIPPATILASHILAPQGPTTTRYFWSTAVEAAAPVTNEELAAGLKHAFDNEDKPMVEAVQQRMNGAELWDLNPVLLPNDAGSVRVRRRLQKLIDAEQRAAAQAKADGATIK